MHNSRESITMRLLIIFLLTSVTFMAQARYEVTVKNTATESDSLQLNGLHIVGVRVASNFNGDSLYVLTADSLDGDYTRVYTANDGEYLGFVAEPGQRYILNPPDYYFFEKYIKLESNTAADAEQTHIVYLGNYK